MKFSEYFPMCAKRCACSLSSCPSLASQSDNVIFKLVSTGTGYAAYYTDHLLLLCMNSVVFLSDIPLSAELSNKFQT